MLRVTESGLDEVIVGVLRIGDVDALTPPIVEAHLEAAADAFDLERSPEGVAWRDLDPDTARGPRVGGVLERTGAMRAGLDLAIGDGRGAVGASAPYAGVHLSGSARVVARPFLGPIDDDTLEAIVRRHLDEATA